MSDVGLFIIEREQGSSYLDIKIEPTGIVADDGLETAVYISLFTDQRCDVEEIPLFETTGQRGWWGDLLSEVDGDRIGSKFWLLKREKTLPQTLQKFIDYAKFSLQWMIEDGIAEDVVVDAEFLRQGVMKMTIQIKKPDGLSVIFSVAWDAQGVK